MSFKKFDDNDLIVNTMRTYPHSEFLIFDSQVYYNQRPDETGIRNERQRNVNNGFVSLYELNIDRPEVSTGRFIGPSAKPEPGEPDTRIPDNARIYPWISKDSAGASFKTVGAVSYNNEFAYGDILSSIYPLTASIVHQFIAKPSAAGSGPREVYVALKNSLNYHSLKSEHYAVVSPGQWNKETQRLNLIHIPSIFYGTKIKPGSVNLEFYYTGSLVAAVSDSNQNGELLQYTSSDASAYNNKVAGVVLYDEGVIVLTGSWELNSSFINLRSPTSAPEKPKWQFFGAGANDGLSRRTSPPMPASFGNASFKISFKGVAETQVMTMFARARKGEVNYSNNPTFLKHNQIKIFNTSSAIYQENDNLQLVNFVSSSYKDYNAPFKRQVYISKIGIYDKNKNLIAVASLSSPILKKDDDDLSFKLKLDI